MGNRPSQNSVDPSVIPQLGRQVDWKEAPGIIPENTIQKLSQYYKYSGGLTDVWECSWRQNSGMGKITIVKVAVKSIRVPSTGDETLIRQAQRKILREVYVWMQLEHDNVLKCYGIVEGFGLLPALVFPWMENGSLDSYLKRRSSALSRVEILDMLRQIAAGLQYLHDRCIVHGDLTCTNVLISEDGRLCLADFGLFMIFAEAQYDTFNSTHAGNVRWMAPEITSSPEGEVKPTRSTDVYSYGCIMLQLLSGRLPYYWLKSASAVVAARARGIEPFRISEIADVNDEHKDYLLRCLSGDSQIRPKVSEIVEFLRTAC